MEMWRSGFRIPLPDALNSCPLVQVGKYIAMSVAEKHMWDPDPLQ